ncbi:MAG: pyridoxal phosphate-dependent decarboxylase family protein [Ilumatobacteraceae bacterium]
MPLPSRGRPADEVLAELRSMSSHDVQWREGRVFSLAYSAGPEVHQIAGEALALYATENGLNTAAFPSLRRLQDDVIGMVSGWVNAPEGAAGVLTTGGTESLLMAVKAAREFGRRTRDIGSPNVVMPTSAHAAFEKGCHYFGVESRRVDVLPDWRADVGAMADAIDENTVMLVASAPQYPQGVIDDVVSIADLAARHGINCHVDACMGGVTLPYLERLGHPIPVWDFRNEGVTSISVDLHKYGYTAKGASVIVHRDKRRRADQAFVTENWLGGLYGSPAVLGTKSGGPWAAAWAVMQYLGDEGYLGLARTARETTERLVTAIRSIPGLVLRAEPDSTLVAFGATGGIDAFAIADVLAERGWYVDRQGPPASLHCTVNAVHEHRIDEFAADLRAAVRRVEAESARGEATAYGTVD